MHAFIFLERIFCDGKLLNFNSIPFTLLELNNSGLQVQQVAVVRTTKLIIKVLFILNVLRISTIFLELFTCTERRTEKLRFYIGSRSRCCAG